MSFFCRAGSLLETPYPFSPGTSPEPTLPVLPPVSPEVPCTSSQEALSPSHVKGESNTSSARSVASNPGSTTLEQSPGATFRGAAPSPPGPADATHNANCQTFISGENFTSSDAGQATSAAETFAATSCSTSSSSSTTCTDVPAATTGLSTFASESTGIKSSSYAGPATSTCKHDTSTSEPTGSSSSAGGTGPVGSPELLESLQQLVQRGDDSHLPQYLHQVTRLPSFLSLFFIILYLDETHPTQSVVTDTQGYMSAAAHSHLKLFLFFFFQSVKCLSVFKNTLIMKSQYIILTVIIRTATCSQRHGRLRRSQTLN